MFHHEYQRIIPDADTAVLCIHGIIGSPDHFDILIPLIPKDFSVYNLLLDGHGKNAVDFSHTSMKKWEMQVSQAVCMLKQTHKYLYIVAHSMGTLFAIEESIHCANIRGLFLLAVPIFPAPKLLMFQNAVKVYLGNIHEDDLFGNAAKASCSIATSRNPLHYAGWILRYAELYNKIRKTRKLLPDLKAPTVAIQSRLDEMVARNADDYLKSHSTMKVLTLEHSYHYLYDPADLILLKSQFIQFITIAQGGKL